MTRLHLFASLAVAAAVLASCASQSVAESSHASRRTTADAATQPVEARTVPVELRFVAKTQAGKDSHGQSLVGKSAVLWFWTSACPAYPSEATAVAQVAASHPGVNFVAVAEPDQVRSLAEFVRKNPLRGFTQLDDAGGSVSAKFGVTRRPAFAFVHPDARIDVVDGQLSGPGLLRRVSDLAGR